MPKLVLWGRDSSANVQKVIWALEELELKYSRIDAGGKFGGLDTPEFAAMNPNRTIPVLQDGDLAMWESSAIVRYLAAQYGAGSMWPESPKARAVCEQWADWAITTFQPAWLEVFVQQVRTPPAQRNITLEKKSMATANKCFALLDVALADKPYLGGETLTYADILAGVSLYRWSRLDVTRIAIPHVDTWHERLKKRPGFVAGVEIAFDAR
jgi:glutathione S-transferase